MYRKILSGSFLVAGTAVGAGMLGIPLLTAQSGFFPAMGITVFTWALLLWTGLLFLEATLWMPLGSHLLSISGRFLGKRGRALSGVTFIFLYYCLLTAYFSAGAPLFGEVVTFLFHVPLNLLGSFALFALVFGGIIALGAKWIDRFNLILITGLVVTYFLLIGLGAAKVRGENLLFADLPKSILALPILFAAFGYHNLIPSLVTYFGKQRKPLRLSIIFGTLIALFIYLVWQWLIMGIVSKEEIGQALVEGKPVTAALQYATGIEGIFFAGQAFAFFALITSLLGVAFSMVDFLADGLKVSRKGGKRVLLTLLTFFPPFLLSALYPTIFDKALGLAGGIGEAILNGLVPVALVWVGRYRKQLTVNWAPKLSNRGPLVFLSILILFVMCLEIYHLLRG